MCLVAIPKVHPNLAGEGTQASPYLIASTTDWNNLVSAVNAGETYSGNYFKILTSGMRHLGKIDFSRE